MDREFAKAMMRHADAIDLLLGSMSEIAQSAPDDIRVQMVDGIFRAVDQLHASVRRPILSTHPDLDQDRA